MPGFKYYTSSINSPIRYAIGLSAVLLAGTEPSGAYIDNSNTISDPVGDHNYTELGFMITNSLAVRVSKKIDIGIDANVGIPLLSNRLRDIGYNDFTQGSWFQFALKAGYRF